MPRDGTGRGRGQPDLRAFSSASLHCRRISALNYRWRGTRSCGAALVFLEMSLWEWEALRVSFCRCHRSC
jgi:hypothetical protein